MRPEAQLIAIVEACGWRRPDKQLRLWANADGRVVGFDALPDYLNDLNAMHEAEKVLTRTQRHDYVALVWDVLELEKSSHFWTEENFEQSFEFASATAAQRAEAFLRALNLWTE